MEEIYRSQFRLPYSLYEHLKASAEKNRRSVNAELIARLEETCAIDVALECVAPGASVTGTAGLLMDMHAQLDERDEEAVSTAMAVYAEKIERNIDSSEQRLSSIEQQLVQVLDLLAKR